MNSEMKALVLIFLCLFAVAAVTLVVCIAPNFASAELHAFAFFALQDELLGDSVGTPGGGG